MNAEIPLVRLVPHTYSEQFSSTRRGAHSARIAAARQLAAWGWPSETEASGTAALIVAELAANAALHGRLPGRDFRLRLTITDGPTLRVEVADARGERWPTLPAGQGESGATGESGRGLLIVDALADKWGTEPRHPSGKTIWAELRLGTALGTKGVDA